MYNKLQYISQGDNLQEQKKNINIALDAGCQWVQLRFKDAPEKEFCQAAEWAKIQCENYGATFIVNDHVQIAKLVDADGVHLGLDDCAIASAKALLGTNKIIGGTANTLQHVIQRQQEGCHYIGLGPLRFTATKKKLSPILGFTGYHEIIAQLPQNHVPIYAIGGITEKDITPLMITGVHGVALSGTITHSAHPSLLVKNLEQLLYDTVANCE